MTAEVPRMALVPFPPAARGLFASPPRPNGALVVAKGVVVDPTLVKNLQREEVAARKVVREKEETTRKDTEFHIALLCSEFRKNKQHRASGLSEALTHVLKDTYESPTRHTASARATSELSSLHRLAPAAANALGEEETQLRRWLSLIEAKEVELIQTEESKSYAFVTRLPRCCAEEEATRNDLVAQEQESHIAFRKAEFLARPPFRPVVQKHVRPPTIEEQETSERALQEQAEQLSRKECHDFLVLRYAVQLFGINRIEVVYRYEIEEEFDESLRRHVSAFLRVRYRCPLLAMSAFHAATSRNDTLRSVAALPVIPQRWFTAFKSK
jgi:hypothetical protein